MSSIHPTHKADEFVSDISNFEIYPFTVDTGCYISDVKEAHLHDFYTIHFIIEGCGSHIIDFKEYDIVSNSLYFVSPGQLHMWKPEGNLSGYVMVFTEEFLKAPDFAFNSVFELKFFHSVAHSPVLRVSRNQVRDILGLLERLEQEFASKQSNYISVIRSFFHIFMVNLERMFEIELKNRDEVSEHRLVRQFKQLVSENYNSQLRVQDYAELLGASASRLSAVVKEVTALTPGQIVRTELVLAAKRMLAHSDLNISEICFELKFDDPSYFGRFFKRETGYTPSVFREHVRGKYQHLAR